MRSVDSGMWCPNIRGTKSHAHNYRTLLDNGRFLIEEKGLKYVASIDKNKKFVYKMPEDNRREKHGIKEIAKSLAPEKNICHTC